MHRGYVKLWRKSKDTGLSCVLMGLWAHCLLEAAHTPVTVYCSGQAVELLPGQFIFGRGAWAPRLGLSEKVLRNLVGILQKRAMIRASKRASTYTVFEIVNWDTYQDDAPQKGQHLGQQKGQPRGQQRASSGPDIKNEENKGISPSSESKDSSEGVCAHGGSLRSRGMNPRAQGTNPRGSVYSESFEQFWAIYPNKTGKGAAYKSWRAVEKKHPGVKPPQIIAALKAQIDADRFRGRDGEFYIPLPTTWLNQARWDDEVRSPGGVGGGRSITDILAREATQ